MAGTSIGGKNASTTNREKYVEAFNKKITQTIKAKYGADFYAKIGAMGGRRTYESGQLEKVNFAANRERARTAGATGGKRSRRAKKDV